MVLIVIVFVSQNARKFRVQNIFSRNRFLKSERFVIKVFIPRDNKFGVGAKIKFFFELHLLNFYLESNFNFYAIKKE
ncbi:hypothetical protein DF185_09890 [Marinifilum breve]|uniref:Uncharacterized protein n=1 Tax=Marinifilum breve TaxID=2184082 RepID=A0A2V3ZYN7_9BACT|nr:hypothetical protein DF185_09890 [Marinifilum breve]